MIRDRGAGPPGVTGLGAGERFVASVLAIVLIVSFAVWAAGEVAGRLIGGRWPHIPPAEAPLLLEGVVRRPATPAMAWPAGARTLLPGPTLLGLFLVLAVSVTTGALVGAALVARALAARTGSAVDMSAGPVRWARSRDLRPLRVRRPQPGRLVLGRHARRLLATDGGHSVLVLGPTQSMKTTGFAIPAILEWQGPVVATSVKADLTRTTVAARACRGSVWIFDPAAVTGMTRAGWTPLAGCSTWQGTQRVASWLVGAAEGSRSGLADADFWYATATKLLAPLLFAATTSGRDMSDVVRWVDTQERAEVEDALLLAGEPAALVAAGASWGRDVRQRSSTYAVVETVLAAYADPGVLACARRADLRPELLLDGGAHTAYLCAPAHEQSRLRPVFTTLVRELLSTAFARADAQGRGLDPPLLVVLDEAANIAPLPDLDALAATASSHGVQLVTVFQDLAQARARYGDRATTIVNNHRAKVLLAGISDTFTLDYASALIGEAEVRQLSATASQGMRSTTTSTAYRRLAPADALRRLGPGHGVLVYGHLPPARLRLRPWFADRGLRVLATGPAARYRRVLRRSRSREP